MSESLNLPIESEFNSIHQVIENIYSNVNKWSSVDAQGKLQLIEELAKIARSKVYLLDIATAKARGASSTGSMFADIHMQATISASYVYGNWLAELHHMWFQIKKFGYVPEPTNTRPLSNGGVAVKVGPFDWTQYILTCANTVELHLPAEAGLYQSNPLSEPPGLTGILGAGNYNVPIDILTAIFIRNKVVVYKPNPIIGQEAISALKILFQPLISAGILAFVEGGVHVGAELVSHPLVSEWYMTGSKQTFESILFSHPRNHIKNSNQPEKSVSINENNNTTKLKKRQNSRLSTESECTTTCTPPPSLSSSFTSQSFSIFPPVTDHPTSENSNDITSTKEPNEHAFNNHYNSNYGDFTHRNSPPMSSTSALKPSVINPLLKNKPVVAELGGCAAVIISPEYLPGPVLRAHARHIAFYTAFNGSHICVRPQVIVTSKKWLQRAQFVREVRSALESAPAWTYFYPGTRDRLERFLEILEFEEKKKRHDVEVNERLSRKYFSNRLPFLFADDVTTTCSLFKEEAFAPLLLEVGLDGPETARDFLPFAAQFVNNNLFGCLASNIIAPAWSSSAKKGLDEAVCTLHHGIVGVNVNAIAAIGMPCAIWGSGRRQQHASAFLNLEAAKNQVSLDSGMGFFGNSVCVKNVEKTVVYAPVVSISLLAQCFSSTQNFSYLIIPRPRFISSRLGQWMFRAVSSLQLSRGKMANNLVKFLKFMYILWLISLRTVT